MKKFIVTLMVCLSMGLTASAQEVATDYNVTMPIERMQQYLDLTDPAAKKIDAWQKELQTKIDEVVKKEGTERSESLKSCINTYLFTLKEYLGPNTFQKYLTTFRNTLKNKHLDEMMQ